MLPPVARTTVVFPRTISGYFSAAARPAAPPGSSRSLSSLRRQRLAVIPRRPCDDSPGTLGSAQLQQPVIGSAELEGAGPLERFRFDQKSFGNELINCRNAEQGCSDDVGPYPFSRANNVDRSRRFHNSNAESGRHRQMASVT